MIFAAAANKLLFNGFDVALVLVLAFGFWRGRKNGMSKELLPVSQWLVIVVGAGLGNEVFGAQLIQWGVIKTVFGNHFAERTAADITAYLLIAGAVWIVFYLLKKYLKPKLEGTNAFGTGEYYLGMISGVIRYACIALFALALVHAPHYTTEEISARKAYNNRWYGGGLQGYSGDFIPSMDELQVLIFNDSLLGPLINQGVGMLLINTVPGSSSKPPVISIH